MRQKHANRSIPDCSSEPNIAYENARQKSHQMARGCGGSGTHGRNAVPLETLMDRCAIAGRGFPN